jgi:hypothetical protein
LTLESIYDGDNLNRVHWKLSSRNDELIIWEFSKPYTSTILILPEISDCHSENEADAVLGIMNSIAVYLVEQGIELTVGRYYRRTEVLYLKKYSIVRICCIFAVRYLRICVLTV